MNSSVAVDLLVNSQQSSFPQSTAFGDGPSSQNSHRHRHRHRHRRWRRDPQLASPINRATQTLMRSAIWAAPRVAAAARLHPAASSRANFEVGRRVDCAIAARSGAPGGTSEASAGPRPAGMCRSVADTSRDTAGVDVSRRLVSRKAARGRERRPIHGAGSADQRSGCH